MNRESLLDRLQNQMEVCVKIGEAHVGIGWMELDM